MPIAFGAWYGYVPAMNQAQKGRGVGGNVGGAPTCETLAQRIYEACTADPALSLVRARPELWPAVLRELQRSQKTRLAAAGYTAGVVRA